MEKKSEYTDNYIRTGFVLSENESESHRNWMRVDLFAFGGDKNKRLEVSLYYYDNDKKTEIFDGSFSKLFELVTLGQEAKAKQPITSCSS